MTYALDFRRKVLSIREQEGVTLQKVADRFHVGCDPCAALGQDACLS